jgi:hypothetical protein
MESRHNLVTLESNINEFEDDESLELDDYMARYTMITNKNNLQDASFCV